MLLGFFGIYVTPFSFMHFHCGICIIPSCAEVLLLSTIFAVLQMPIFGDKLVDSDCTACFLITTRILPEFALLCIGTVLNVAVNVWLYRKAHSIIYHQT